MQKHRIVFIHILLWRKSLQWRSVFFLGLIWVCGMPLGATAAPIPNRGQIGLASNVDIGVHGRVWARFYPKQTGPTDVPSVAPDPTGSGRSAMGLLGYPTTSDPSLFHWTEYRFEHLPDIELDSRPNELTIEGEIYIAGLQEWYEWLRLSVDTVRGERYIQLGTRDANAGRISYPNITGNTVTQTTTPLTTNEWRKYRLAVRAATTPGPEGSLDGQLHLWLDDVGGNWSLIGSVENGIFGKVNTMAPGFFPRRTSDFSSAYHRRLAWIDQFVDPNDQASLWIDYPASLGAQFPDGHGGVAQRFVMHYDHALSGSVHGPFFRIEYTTPDDPEFANAQTSGWRPLRSGRDWTETQTVTGLTPGSQYLYRTVMMPEFGHEVRTDSGHFKTLTVPGGEPGIIRFAFGGDSNSRATPHRSQITMLDDDLNFMIHLGDIDNIDGRLSLALGNNWFRYATRDDFGDNWARNLTSSTWQALHTQVPLVPVWDDHDLHNNWSGAEWEESMAWQQRLLIEGQAAANIWLDTYQPPMTTFGTTGYKPKEPEGYTSNDIHYFHFDTAAARFIMLDPRRFKDTREGSRQMIGSDQLAWALDLLENTTQPYVFLASGQNWTSTDYKPEDRWLAFEEYRVERQAIFDAALGNDAIHQIILLAADNHFSVVSDPDLENDRLGPEFIVAPLAQTPHDPSHDKYENLIYGPDDMDRYGIGPARLYGYFELDEINGTLLYQLRNGETGDVRFEMNFPAMLPTPTTLWAGAVMMALCSTRRIRRYRISRP